MAAADGRNRKTLEFFFFLILFDFLVIGVGYFFLG